MEVQVSGEISDADKDCHGDSAVDQSADAMKKCLSLSESEPGSLSEDTIQPGPGKKSNQQDKKDTVKTNQPPLDPNANTEAQDKVKQSKKKGKNEQNQQQKDIPAPKQEMVFGPRKMVDLIRTFILKLIEVEKLKTLAYSRKKG